MPLQHDAVLGQRAGLVGAQHIHAAEVLDGIEPLDDHLLAAHRQRALGQADRDDHRQHLRRQAHRHGHREEEGALPVVLGEAVDQEDQRHHHGHQLDHQPGEAVEPLSKLVSARSSAIELAMLPKYVWTPVATTTAVAVPLSTLVPMKQMFFSSVANEVALSSRVVELLDRQRFAGQASLADEQILRRQHPHVARNHVAGGELDDVAGNQVAQRHFLRVAVADHGRRHVDHGLELRARPRPPGPPAGSAGRRPSTTMAPSPYRRARRR